MTKVFPTRWCTGASMGPQKPLCHRNLWRNTLYIYTLTIFKKQIPPPKKIPFQNGRPMIYFVSHHFNFGKNMKNHFSKGVFQWNLSHGFSGKSYFPASPKCWFMLISEKTTGFVWFIYVSLFYFILFDFLFLFIYLFIYFFTSKEGYPWGWHLKIAPVKNFDPIVIKYRGLQKTVVGPVGDPLLSEA